jgi:hypothetical protein
MAGEPRAIGTKPGPKREGRGRDHGPTRVDVTAFVLAAIAQDFAVASHVAIVVLFGGRCADRAATAGHACLTTTKGFAIIKLQLGEPIADGAETASASIDTRPGRGSWRAYKWGVARWGGICGFMGRLVQRLLDGL